MSTAAAYLLLVLTAGLLCYVALTDLRAYRIPNAAVIALVALYFAHAAVSGRWMELHWNVAFAALMTLLMLLSYARGVMGGGDLKLLAAAFLWTGAQCAVPFLVILLVVALIHVGAARLGWVGSQRTAEGRMKLPFGPSIAAGLIGVFMLGCLAP